MCNIYEASLLYVVADGVFNKQRFCKNRTEICVY